MIYAAGFNANIPLHLNQINCERSNTNRGVHKVYRMRVPQACNFITKAYQTLLRVSLCAAEIKKTFTCELSQCDGKEVGSLAFHYFTANAM